MAYFTAVLARTGRAWRARDVDLDDAASLDELADTLRAVSVDDEPVLAVVEHEDEWFALVRVDGDEEPRLFVSDIAAAGLGHYAELLSAAADVDVLDDDPVVPDGSEREADDEEDGEQPEPLPAAPPAWAGEVDLLEDMGVSGRTLRLLVQDRGEDPAGVLAEIGEQVGFGDLLAALR